MFGSPTSPHQSGEVPCQHQQLVSKSPKPHPNSKLTTTKEEAKAILAETRAFLEKEGILEVFTKDASARS